MIKTYKKCFILIDSHSGSTKPSYLFFNNFDIRMSNHNGDNGENEAQMFDGKWYIYDRFNESLSNGIRKIYIYLDNEENLTAMNVHQRIRN